MLTLFAASSVPNRARRARGMRPAGVLLLALLGVAAGCTQKDLSLQAVPAADQALALTYVDFLRQRNFDQLDRVVDASVRGPQLYDALLKNAASLPEEAPTSRKLVRAQISTDPNGTRTDLVYELGFSGKWVLANVAMLRKPDSVALVGLRILPEPESLEQRHAFTLAGKSAKHWAVLALAVAFPLLTLYALLTCLTTRLAGMKWPWVLFILLSFGRWSLNWTTGDTQFVPLSIGVFGASLTGQSFGAWTLSLSLPLGPLVFLLRKRALTAVAPKP